MMVPLLIHSDTMHISPGNASTSTPRNVRT
jgi:hypothetical protein